jgi:cobalamin biosynthesis protein CobD/CbiB
MNTENVKSENSKLPILDVSGMLHPDIEKLLRYAVKQWSSLNEQREPDHEDLVQNWLDGDCKEWIQRNYR